MVILIAEDELGIRRALELLLKTDHDVISCPDGAAALKELSNSTIDLVITDYQMPNLSGIELIKRGKQISPSTSFIMMTAFGSIHQAVEAIQLGAEDYLTKPFDVSEIEHRIRRVEELRSYKIDRYMAIDAEPIIKRIQGTSKFVEEARKFISSAASTHSPVLLEGPGGSGKQFIARLIHEASPRGIYPFIVFDCTQGDETFMETDLFGLESGNRDLTAPRAGKVELARGGTLFLDAIGDLPKSLQTKLLKLIQDKVYRHVGSTRELRTNVRLIAANPSSLRNLVVEKVFSEELFYQINLLNFGTVPVNERAEDVPALITYFWEKLRKETRNSASLAPATIECLVKYAYPGNVRELENVLERLVVTGPRKGTIGPERLPVEFRNSTKAEERGLEEQLADLERALLTQAVNESPANLGAVAKKLKISEDSLTQRLEKHAIRATKKAA